MNRKIKQSNFVPKQKENKLEEFAIQDFIERLTDTVDCKEQNNRRTKEFASRPYLLKFDNVINQIRHLRTQIDEEIKIESKSCREDEANYKSQISGFMTELQQITHDFRILDGKISKVSQSALRIGDRLETVETQRQEIIDTEELIGYFLRLNKDKQYRDVDNILYQAESGDDLYKAAKLIIQLLEIGNALTLPETQNARDEIENISARIKRLLNQEFATAYQLNKRCGDQQYISVMKESATILDGFNDKQFVHEFLDLFLADMDFKKYVSRSFTQVSKLTVQFMNHVSFVLQTAIKLIYKVFPKSRLVVKELIIKAFKDQIAKYLATVITTNYRLDELNNMELNEYLLIVNVIYQNTNDLLKDLKANLSQISTNDITVAQMLEEQELMSIVFDSCQQSYIGLEIKHLKTEIKTLIKECVIEPLKIEENDLSDDIKSNNIHISITSPSENNGNKKSKHKFLSAARTRTMTNSRRRLTTQIMKSTRTYSKKKLDEIKKKLPMSAKEIEEMIDRLNNIFEMDNINECVLTMKTQVYVCLNRCINLSLPSELSSNMNKLFIIYLENGVNILFRQTLMSICKEILSAKGSKDRQHWYFLNVVQDTNKAIQLVEQCFMNDIAPLITDTFDFAVCKQDKDQIYTLLQNDLLEGLKELLDIVLNKVDTILGKQQKIDFKPKTDVTNVCETTACILACEYIDEFIEKCLHHLGCIGKNMDNLFLCFGKRLLYNIIEHCKRYEYNPIGAMVLVKDAKKYQNIAKKLGIERINELFLILVVRANLISIPSDSILPYINSDDKLCKIRKNELKQWLKLRTDYKSSKIESKVFQ